MQWFQIREQAAGRNRLKISWWLYKVFGKNALYLIAFFVAFFTFVFAGNVRAYSRKYFTVIEPYTGLKPNLLNQFKHICSYALGLVDKMLVYSGNFDINNVVFENEDDKKMFFDDIEKQKGVFFICNHIGNIEVLQGFSLSSNPEYKINIFLSRRQSQIFNEFIDEIKQELPVRIFPIEEIGVDTVIELKDNLDKGDIVFIAGDRLAENNDSKCVEQTLFARKIFLPVGTFKLAKLMEVPTYFITALKCGGKYKVYLEKQYNLSENELIASYTKYLEKMILVNPFQFFHFFDFFARERLAPG